VNEWHGDDMMRFMQRELEKRVTRACIYLTGEVKQVLSVPAPRKRVYVKSIVKDRKVTVTFNPASVTATPFNRTVNTLMYVATVPATPLAPPRKLSGNLRRKITWEVKTIGGEVRGRVGTNVIYGRKLELDPKNPHQYLAPTLAKNLPQITRILKG
jgi:hypothetical protein